ncbi:ABC transporter permease [Arsenicitalea aurantiaca]|uniref:ABC transporter permease n=1 Tax=Arsenicitalea aurantiaca TaxID=1783274 RepID=A0A433X7T0_9HYPH|nr:ABC transporter permease [Arsenicitalea aurantiaca]RUT30115.1 ABC transporter permease [Arsenicitalea aurantiaca]
MQASAVPLARPRQGQFRFRLDLLGVVIAALGFAGLFLPFAAFRANRIVPGEGAQLFIALGPVWGVVLLSASLLVLAVALLRTPARLRLAASLSALLLLLVLIGEAGRHLTPEGDALARVSPGSGFWVLLAAFALLAADALSRLALSPLMRIGLVLGLAAVLAAILLSGAWDALSVLREYENRASAFWREAETHVLLAFGSLAAATLVGVPLGMLCHKVRPLRAATLNVLNMVQTIPSIALFGLLIAPLAWVAANVPGASALGVSGIGTAPALVALFAYSLLPVVANTVVGLGAVPRAANDAARGMGMTNWQRLAGVQMPLAFPVILTGIRIVLVQNIGLATIAALIGGGGFGVFVFQGIGQTAMDLVLLGAVPTVILAMGAGIVLDALVELASPQKRGRS